MTLQWNYMMTLVATGVCYLVFLANLVKEFFLWYIITVLVKSQYNHRLYHSSGSWFIVTQNLINVVTKNWQMRTKSPFLADSWIVIKQFVVTNCSKKRSGSIVTKTLKNWILISIATSKESHFNADFKYISFIKFSLSHQKLRAGENLPYLGK